MAVDVGLNHVQVATTVIGSQEQAEQRHFHGSPTILIDGVDRFADVGHAPALACRVYPGPSGIPRLALRQVRLGLREMGLDTCASAASSLNSSISTHSVGFMGSGQFIAWCC